MTKQFTIKTAPEFIDDELVVSQLPASVQERLGEWEGSGFNFDTGARDVDFFNGFVVYKPGSTEVYVETFRATAKGFGY